MGLLAEKFMDYVSAPEDDELQEDRGLYGTSTDAYNSSIQAGIVLFKPKDFAQARAIIDHLMPNHAVLINLEEVAQENLRRMVDFFAGVAYGIQGTFTRAARLTYVIIPPDVELEDQLFDKWEQEEDPLVL